MTGWSCPKCQRVYAPFVAECTKCNATVRTGTGTWPSPYIPYGPGGGTSTPPYRVGNTICAAA